MTDGPPLLQLGVTIASTGRTVMLAVPTDLSAAELLEFVSWLTTPDGFRASLPKRSPIIVPFMTVPPA